MDDKILSEKDYTGGFPEYLKRNPDFDPAAAELFDPIYGQIDEDFYVFIMTQVVL